MTTTQILAGIGLAVFFVFGCFAIISLDDLRHSISSIQANTRRIADNVATPGEQVDHLIQEIRDEAELRRRDTQPEQSWPSKDRLDKPLSEYKDQAEITAEVAARLEKNLADQQAAQLAHCSCIWDIVWTPQIMAQPGDKMERREGIAQYDRNCPVHGHRSPDNRREDQ